MKSTYISGITSRPMSFQFMLPVISRLYMRMTHNESQIRKMFFKDYNLPPEKFNKYRVNIQRLSRENFVVIGKEIMQYKVDRSYANINTPVKIVAGSLESSGIKQSLQDVPKIIASAESEIIPDAKHGWPIIQPGKFNQHFLDWLEKNSNG